MTICTIILECKGEGDSERSEGDIWSDIDMDYFCKGTSHFPIIGPSDTTCGPPLSPHPSRSFRSWVQGSCPDPGTLWSTSQPPRHSVPPDSLGPLPVSERAPTRLSYPDDRSLRSSSDHPPSDSGSPRSDVLRSFNGGWRFPSSQSLSLEECQ